MRIVLWIFIFFFSLPSLSDPQLDGESLLSETPQETKQQLRQTNSTRKTFKKIETTNLPLFYQQKTNPSTTESLLLYPQDAGTLRLLRAGDKLQAHISHSVIAFTDEKTPLVAKVKEGIFKNSSLIGFSRLEEKSKLIFIEFETFSHQSETYPVKALALSSLGDQGFQGEYQSKEIKYASLDFISTFISAYFDSQVPKQFYPLGGSPFGATIEDTSLESATKKAFSKSALSSAERFREKLKKNPEFSQIKGPISIQVLVLNALKQTQNN